MKKFAVIVALLACVFSFGGCSQKTDKDSDTAVNPAILTLEERKDIFASYFNHSEEYNVAEIKENLDKTDMLKVLTLDEALSAFWLENGLDPNDYLQKTSENGQVYYQHKVENNEIKVYVNLLYPQTEDENADVTETEDYGFYIIQTCGQNYFISVNGDISVIE